MRFRISPMATWVQNDGVLRNVRELGGERNEGWSMSQRSQWKSCVIVVIGFVKEGRVRDRFLPWTHPMCIKHDKREHIYKKLIFFAVLQFASLEGGKGRRVQSSKALTHSVSRTSSHTRELYELRKDSYRISFLWWEREWISVEWEDSVHVLGLRGGWGSLSPASALLNFVRASATALQDTKKYFLNK